MKKLRILSLILGFLGAAVWVWSSTNEWTLFRIFVDYNHFVKTVELMHFNLLVPIFFILFGIFSFFKLRSLALAASGINVVFGIIHIAAFFIIDVTLAFFMVAFPPAIMSFICFGLSIYFIVKHKKASK